MPMFYACCAAALLFGPVQFRFWRRAFLFSMLLALPWYAIYPLAPPRFMPQYGFRDTLMEFGPKYFSSDGLVSANQYAAMPSMHIGWTTIAALMLATCVPSIKGFPIRSNPGRTPHIDHDSDGHGDGQPLPVRCDRWVDHYRSRDSPGLVDAGPLAAPLPETPQSRLAMPRASAKSITRH